MFDNNSRGNSRRLAEFARDIEIVEGDIRDLDALMRAADGIDEMHHLAFVNGTTYFYEFPELVLDVGVPVKIRIERRHRKRQWQDPVAELVPGVVSPCSSDDG